MPRIYVSASDYPNYPEAIAFLPQIAALQAISGGLDKLLARASKRVDGFCRKRVVSPPATTIAASGGISPNATSVNLTSTLGYDSGQEMAVRFNPGGINDEIVPVAPGGVLVTNWASPYPGTITLLRSEE